MKHMCLWVCVFVCVCEFVCVCVWMCVRPPAFSQLQLKDLVHDLDVGVKWDPCKVTKFNKSQNSQKVILKYTAFIDFHLLWVTKKLYLCMFVCLITWCKWTNLCSIEEASFRLYQTLKRGVLTNTITQLDTVITGGNRIPTNLAASIINIFKQLQRTKWNKIQIILNIYCYFNLNFSWFVEILEKW